MDDPLWIWMFCVGPHTAYRPTHIGSVFSSTPDHVDYPNCPHHAGVNGVLYTPIINDEDDPYRFQMYVKLPASEWRWIWPLLMDEPLERAESL